GDRSADHPRRGGSDVRSGARSQGTGQRRGGRRARRRAPDAPGVPRHGPVDHERAPRRPDASRLRRGLRAGRDRVAVRSRCAGRRRPETGGTHGARPDRRPGELGVPPVRHRLAAADDHRRRADVVAPPRMRTRTLVVLAVIAAALGAVLVIDARVRRHGADERAARARVLPPFDRKTVQKISIRRQQGESFELVRAASPTAPAPAPTWRVETAWQPAALDLAESERSVEISPAAAGLQPPVGEIALQTTPQAKEAIALQLGRPEATGQGVYARAGTAGPIRVVSRRLLELVNRDPAAFRDRRLIPIDPTAVTAIEWHLLVSRRELHAVDGRWQNGSKEWVDEGRVFELLRRLFALRID